MILKSLMITWIAVFLFVSCSGKSTDPAPVEYRVYVAASHWTNPWNLDTRVDLIYVLDADSLAVVDSILLTEPAQYMAVSSDGTALFAQCYSDESRPCGLSKIASRTGQVLWSLSGERGLTMLGNGTLLLRDGGPFSGGCGATVIRASDGALLGSIGDTLCVRSYGSFDGTIVAVLKNDPDTLFAINPVITAIDVETEKSHGWYVPHLSDGDTLVPRSAVLHPDGNRVLVTGSGWLVVGDITTGATLFQHDLGRYNGEITMNADGSLAVITDPPYPFRDADSVLDVFDLVGMRHAGRLTRDRDGLQSASQALFLRGGRKLVVGRVRWYTGPLQLIDLSTMTIERTTRLQGVQIHGALAVGPRPTE